MSSHSDSNINWVKLVQALREKTEGGTLKWESTSTQTAGITTVDMMTSAFGQPQVFTAAASKSAYQISSGAGTLAPYELRVWDSRSRKGRPIAVIASALDAINADTFVLNRELERLHRAVDASVESPEQVVGRLLRDLDDLS